MTVRVALNGFGRIGRSIFRVLYDREDVEVVAISDPANAENLLYLLRYDSISGPFKDPIGHVDGRLVAKGRLIPLLDGRAPGDVNWRDYDVDIVIEASGRYRSRAELQKHLDAGARRVVLTVPPEDEIDGIFVDGVNYDAIDSSKKIVSTGSGALNALAPVLKLLEENFGISEAFYSIVHAYTNDLRLADVPNDDFRRSRSAAENILPASTKSPVRLDLLMPNLASRVDGIAISVPVPDGSVVDLVTYHDKPVSKEDVNAVMWSASETTFARTLEYCKAPIVSTDVTGNPHSAIFDSLMTTTLNERDPDQKERRGMVKSLTWYDNGWSYSNRVVDLALKLAETF